MSERDLRNDSQKYLDEMMKFYSMNRNASVNTPVAPPLESVATENVRDNISGDTGNDGEFDSSPNEPYDDIADEEENENMSGMSEMSRMPEIPKAPEMPDAPDIAETGRMPEFSDKSVFVGDDGKGEISFESRFPLPVIPDFIRKENSGSAAEQSERTADSYGFLKVEVRTGENGLPVPGAAVTVSEKKSGGENIVFTGTADQSGETPKIKLSAPINRKGNTPESFQNYSVYTVSVFAKDFFREVSADVPIFAGITSIQRFNLIPMPFNYGDSGQSIVTENTEPNI